MTEFTATVATTDDTIDEADETFTLTVGGKTGTATIIDNDDAPTIDNVSQAVNADGDAVDEGEGAVFTVSLSNASSSAQTFTFSLADGTRAATTTTQTCRT
ncbi:hypothetical protein KDW99_08060 [Marinomonas rhizomae]|uniref:hypothetical protein n=1 Tax=Marinomonas rhizomae TaxID=491948 RepID=UPI00210710E6|nr:hypothetical protein [Marinomonas rhizomae]UTW01068.1 hypothetical protein KDW99_08060 [Marinomonas rhizomae]